MLKVTFFGGYFLKSNQKKHPKILHFQQRKYADSVNDRVSKDLFGLKTQIKYLNQSVNNDPALASATNNSTLQDDIDFKLIEEAIERDLLYMIFINHASEQFNSINLFIFNKWRVGLDQLESINYTNCTIKENKNMPLNKALELLRPDYYDYISFLKLSNQKTNLDDEKNEFDDDLSEASDNERELDAETENLSEENATPEFILDANGKQLFDVIAKKFAQSSHLTLKDIDFMLTFLRQQKESVIDRSAKQPINNSTPCQPPLPSGPAPLVHQLQTATNYPPNMAQQPPLPPNQPPPSHSPQNSNNKSQPVALMSLMSGNFNNNDANGSNGNGNGSSTGVLPPQKTNQNFNHHNNNNNRFRGNNYNRF
jgi:hypothetical protein